MAVWAIGGKTPYFQPSDSPFFLWIPSRPAAGGPSSYQLAGRDRTDETIPAVGDDRLKIAGLLSSRSSSALLSVGRMRALAVVRIGVAVASDWSTRLISGNRTVTPCEINVGDPTQRISMRSLSVKGLTRRSTDPRQQSEREGA
jgi:hypothetical protein